MPCHRVGNAIVCTGRRPLHRCGCGHQALFQCDWKVGNGKTCDEHLCELHALQVADDKHLCPKHQVTYEQWRARKRASTQPAPKAGA